MSSALEMLPDELLDQVISILAKPPPSFARLHHPPVHQITKSQCKDLKHLSQVSCRLLNLIRPRLFSHVRFELREESAFYSFIVTSGLGQYVKSLVVITSDARSQYANALWWRRALRYLDPARITIVAPPVFIGRTLNTRIMDGHSWAFDIEFQIFQLEQEIHSPRASPLPDLGDCRGLLLARPWTSMFFNESSSLKAYNHYEYFLSRVPSVIGEWGSRLKEERALPPEFSIALSGLTSFTYTAVFPFYNHVKLILDVLEHMPVLRSLTVQLAPGANNHATEVEQRGSMDPNDPWMELATAYSLISFEVCRKQSLQMFHSRDFTLEALRAELCQILGDGLGHTGWTHDGHGSWTREKHDESET